MKAVASSAPAAMLNMCCVYRANTPNPKIAANQTLPIPANKVPSRMATKTITFDREKKE